MISNARDSDTGKKPVRLRFNLRFLLVAMAVSAIAIAWMASAIRKAKVEIEIVQKYEGNNAHGFETVRFEHEQQTTHAWSPVSVLRKYTVENLCSPVSHICITNKSKLGIFDEVDLDLTHVRSVELHYLMNLEDLSILDRCKDLRSLTIEFCNVKKFKRLQEFERLEEVYLWTSGPAKVLPHIKNHRIKKLRYNFISWDAEEIELLCQFKHLETLDLGDYWTLSEEHAVKLKTRLPHVKISYKPESAGYHQ